MKPDAFRLVGCALAGVHAVDAFSKRGFPRHVHDQFGIGLIRCGAQKSTSGRGMVEAGAGMVITVNPGEVHDGAPIGDGGRRWTMLYFDPETLQSVFEAVDGTSGTFEFHHPVIDSSELAHRFAGLYQAMTQDGASPCSAEEMALLLIDWLVPYARRDRAHDLSGIERVRDRIDDAPAEAASLSELADLCGLSSFQLLRSFVRVTGLTPHAYRLQRRVHRARRLIMQGIPLAEVAAECGFFDQSHMSRHFTRILGTTPGAHAAALK